ncbi:MAG: hypothetical protein Q4C96_00100 [Planctomycetia bacterium]|nr:hypothetical protein [Planctomycetia bacterium]
MDQIKVAIKKIRKFGFWVLFGVSLIAILFTWKMVTGSLQKNLADRSSKLEATYKSMQAISAEAELANKTVVEQVEIAVKRQSENVLNAWKKRYDAQQEKNVWPVTAANFRDYFNNPQEKVRDDGSYVPIPDIAREYYMNFISEYVKNLKVKYDIKRPRKNLTGAGDVRSAQREMMDTGISSLREEFLEGTVYWDDRNFSVLQHRLTWDNPPETLEIIIAQEDLWIYEMLLGIIQNINEGRTDFNAVIKEIIEINIAQDTAESFEKAAERIVDQKALEDFLKQSGQEVSSASSSEDSTSSSLTEDTGEVLTARQKLELKVYDERYVDLSGKPLTAQEFKESPPSVEYKLVPFHLKLIINQRYIGELLIYCANAKMPIEVRQLSINPELGQKFTLTAEEEEQVRTRRQSGSRQRASSTEKSSRSNEIVITDARRNSGHLAIMGPEDVELEMFGMIYVYNRPDIKKLILSEEQEETGVENSEVEETEETEETDVSEEEPTSVEPETEQDISGETTSPEEEEMEGEEREETSDENEGEPPVDEESESA